MSKKAAFILAALLAAAAVGAGIAIRGSQDEPSPVVSEESATQSATPRANASPVPAAGQVREIAVEAGNFYFNPKEIRVKKGDRVTITLTSKGMNHNFIIDELNVRMPTTSPGATRTTEFTANQTGEFTYYCGIGNHREMGQTGKLIVE